METGDSCEGTQSQGRDGGPTSSRRPLDPGLPPGGRSPKGRWAAPSPPLPSWGYSPRSSQLVPQYSSAPGVS